jgi:molecular chaperone DnaK
MGIGKRGDLSHSLGIETGAGRFVPLIKKGTPLPAAVTETFTTADANQSSIKIKPMYRAYPLNKSLGLYEVTEIPPAGAVQITFSIDAGGLLSVTAQDRLTGQELPVFQRGPA